MRQLVVQAAQLEGHISSSPCAAEILIRPHVGGEEETQPLPFLDHCLRTVNSPLGTPTDRTRSHGSANHLPLSLSSLQSILFVTPSISSSFFSKRFLFLATARINFLSYSLLSYLRSSFPRKIMRAGKVNIRFTRLTHASPRLSPLLLIR